MKKKPSAPFVGQATNWLTRIRLKSLRLRLALWALVLLGFTQVCAGAILYLSISTWLLNQVDDNLIRSATQVSSFLYDTEESFNVSQAEDIQTEFTTLNRTSQALLQDQRFFVRVIDLRDSSIMAASSGADIPLSDSLSQIENFVTFNLHIPTSDAVQTSMRVYTLVLSFAPDYALQVGQSLAEAQQMQSAVLRVLLVLCGVTAVISLLSGWFLGNRALIPVRATALTAAKIDERDLGQRLSLDNLEIELTQLVHTFNAMLDRIEDAFQRQKKFTADAAHELRTPLSIMQTSLDVTLSQPRSADDYRRTLLSAQEEVERLTRLTAHLLSLARMDETTPSTERTQVNLSLLLQTVADQFTASAAEKSITLTRKIHDNIYLEGDEARLIQLAVNLVDNAIKFTPSGGTVAISAEDNESSEVNFTIEDTGIGIPPEAQLLIFERFYRVDQARNRRQGGAGLGLAIVKQIVELHHGTITVESTVGKSSRFTICFPSTPAKSI